MKCNNINIVSGANQNGIQMQNIRCRFIHVRYTWRWAGIATRYGLDGPGIESRWGRDFPHLSRPALGPTQPPSTCPDRPWGQPSLLYNGYRVFPEGTPLIITILQIIIIIVLYCFFVIKPTRCTTFPILLRHETQHVSGSSSAHHQEFIHCTVGTGICQTRLKTAFEQFQPGPARKLSTNLYDIYQCWVCSE